MRNILILLLSLLSCNLAFAQQIKVEGSVIDAETGEKLPYVRIEVSEGKKISITNHEGDFLLQVDADDVLCFSFVGYEKRYIKARELTASVVLKPWDNILNELTVLAGDALLLKVNKLMKKEHSRYKKEESQYFMRMITHYDGEQELTETFMTARSMGHLRDPRVVSGRYGHSTPKAEGELEQISAMNFHHILEAGPWLRHSKFWDTTITPLHQYQTKATLREHYDVSVQMLRDNTGNGYYRFTLRRVKRIETSCIVIGYLYVDAATLRPLRFDGLVENLMLEVGHDRGTSTSAINTMHINISYDQSKGYTEVASMACDLYSRGLGFRALGILMKVDNIDLGTEASDGTTQEGESKDKRKRVNENLLSSIDKVGFDDELWERSNIIKRTADETKALGMNMDEADSGEAYQMHSIKWLRLIPYNRSPHMFMHNIMEKGTPL